MNEELYPPGPAHVPEGLTLPSKAYKQRAWMALASLAAFLLIYLSLTAWFAWTAWRLFEDAFISGADGLLNCVVGAGAAFLAIFMLKALFFWRKGGASDAVEITPAEQPRLFEFLHRLADEAGAPRPAKVFLTPRVNAAVFYDLSILNLLLPSRKNLEIGLALVNVLTVSELKAVLAHEFGHFAQRSMAIGSWVYVAQQIATQVIAKRDALDKLLQALSRFDIRIAWVGWLMSLIVWSIRSLMDTLLRGVVLAQRALSRQMEFQADLVAVSLTGSDEIVHALHKLQAADEAWSRTLHFADAQVRQGQRPHDLFKAQTWIIERTAGILADDSYGRVPASHRAGDGASRLFKTSFAQPPQMWSTHPASVDREDNAKRVYLPSPHDERSAWLLFDRVDEVKDKVVDQLLGGVTAERATPDDMLRALDERYSLLQYDTRYRGAYLGRALTRHAAQPDELVESALQRDDIQATLAALYPERLATDLSSLRELDEERATLVALRDKVYQATGGRLVHRGQEISRRQLPAVISQVTAEAEAVRQRILAHDRQCRGAHLAAARQLGGGWPAYLQGLIQALHYAEHSLADVRDAQGMLGNVVAVVTADGKVSGSELKRLVAAANALHEVLARLHGHKDQVQLDASLLARLETESWAALLGDFDLPAASSDNISQWLGVIDSWVNALAGACGALVSAALEQLLLAEREVARQMGQVGQEGVPDGEPRETAEAPLASRLPASYAVLQPGQERERQKKLGWWDRFQTADGAVATCARLLVALGIVSAVLGFGGSASVTSTLSIYNGLGQPVNVVVGGQVIEVAPFSATTASVELAEGVSVSARTRSGEQIEVFAPRVEGRARHYVYNVAAASPMVEWTAVYGNAAEREPTMLGASRWFTSHAEVYFTDPPGSVSTKGGGATRLVLASPGDAEPEAVLRLLPDEAQRRQVIAAHARWDLPEGSAHAERWKTLAKTD